MILDVFHEARKHLEPIGVPLKALVVERFDFMLGKEDLDVRAVRNVCSTYRELVDYSARPPAMFKRHIWLEFKSTVN